jgi:RNA-binding protein YlmH
MDKYSENRIEELALRRTNSDFMDPFAQKEAEAVLRRLGIGEYSFYGGYDGAERKILMFNSSHELCILKLSVSKGIQLSHRDCLGSILGQGIDRCKIGDILTEGGCAYVFTVKSMAGYLTANLQKAGNAPLKNEILDIGKATLPPVSGAIKEIITSSMRVDAVIAAALKLSRSEAAGLVSQEKVYKNWVPVKSPASSCAPGDNISVRGRGRIRLICHTGRTRKERYITSVEIF